MYDATLPAAGDTAIGTIIDHAKTLGVSMSDDKGNLFQEKGGPEYALLQRTTGVFFVVIQVSTDNGTDSHVVVYNAGHVDRETGNRGCIVDNCPKSNPMVIEDSDRADKHAARKVWKAPWPNEGKPTTVRIKNVWRMFLEPSIE